VNVCVATAVVDRDGGGGGGGGGGGCGSFVHTFVKSFTTPNQELATTLASLCTSSTLLFVQLVLVVSANF